MKQDCDKQLIIEEAHYQNGNWDIRAKHPAFAIIIDECARMFDESGAINFLAMEGIDIKNRRFAITLQLSDGETPAVQLERLKAENTRLHAEANINMKEICRLRGQVAKLRSVIIRKGVANERD